MLSKAYGKPLAMGRRAPGLRGALGLRQRLASRRVAARRRRLRAAGGHARGLRAGAHQGEVLRRTK